MTMLLTACLMLAADAEAAWQAGPVLLEPGPAGSFDEVAVKDPSVVHYGGRWHVFYTARSRNAYSLGYVNAPALDQLNAAPRTALASCRGQSEPYAAAPQVFYFAPRATWFLVYQTRDARYQPVYSTCGRVDDPAGWSPPKPLVAKNDGAKWIDFWVICDATTAYFFYTRAHRDVYVQTTPIDAFPEGFGAPRKVFGPVHEAVHIYKAQGQNRYHMLYETQFEHDLRRFGLAAADALAGPWRRVDEEFAAAEQLRWPEGARAWTEEVSHGELIRVGYDQRLEYAPARTRFLIQGLRREQHVGEYTQLPWRLGLIERAVE